jgi:riboflavin transporter
MKTNTVTNQNKRNLSTKQMVIISMFGALSYVLMLFHLPYKHLGFLEFEFSDVPAVIATLTYGPLAGIIIELIKNLVKALTASTTGMIGELTNFIISCAYVLPVGLLYNLRNRRKSDRTEKSKVMANAYLIFIFCVGVISMSVIAALLNYFIMIPLYAKFFGGLDGVIGFASKSVPAIKDLASMVIIGITPFNVVKGAMISIIGYYTYRLLKGRII